MDLAEPDLYLCNTHRHLLLAMASIQSKYRPATLVYLQDHVPVPPALQIRLATLNPETRFVYTTDAAQQVAFARLPGWLPAVVRRNLSWEGWRMIRPQNWQSPVLADSSFATGYFSHTGFFLAKVLAQRCRSVVLRESGLNNYLELPLEPLKALLRACVGLSPRRQIWGEEPWVTRIEVTRPEDLPAAVRAKGVAFSFVQALQALPAVQAQALAQSFLGADLSLEMAIVPRRALLLSQPLEGAGICDGAAQQALYRDLAYTLQQHGFEVWLKPHPRDATFSLPGCNSLPACFPIEAWPFCGQPRFDVAVALCSAALDQGNVGLAKTMVQMVSPEVLNATDYGNWKGQLSPRLAAILAELPRDTEQA